LKGLGLHRAPKKKDYYDGLNEEGLVNSMRILDHKIQEIRAEIHLEIPYDRRINSYSLSDEDSKSLNDLAIIFD